jgi:coatomer subunit zeta
MLTSAAIGEIILFEGLTCVYKSNVDLFFYVIGSATENELLLSSVLSCFYDTVSVLVRCMSCD